MEAVNKDHIPWGLPCTVPTSQVVSMARLLCMAKVVHRPAYSGLYRQVVLLYRWSLRQVSLYKTTWQLRPPENQGQTNTHAYIHACTCTNTAYTHTYAHILYAFTYTQKCHIHTCMHVCMYVQYLVHVT